MASQTFNLGAPRTRIKFGNNNISFQWTDTDSATALGLVSEDLRHSGTTYLVQVILYHIVSERYLFIIASPFPTNFSGGADLSDRFETGGTATLILGDREFTHAMGGSDRSSPYQWNFDDGQAAQALAFLRAVDSSTNPSVTLVLDDGLAPGIDMAHSFTGGLSGAQGHSVSLSPLPREFAQGFQGGLDGSLSAPLAVTSPPAELSGSLSESPSMAGTLSSRNTYGGTLSVSPVLSSGGLDITDGHMEGELLADGVRLRGGGLGLAGDVPYPFRLSESTRILPVRDFVRGHVGLGGRHYGIPDTVELTLDFGLLTEAQLEDLRGWLDRFRDDVVVRGGDGEIDFRGHGGDLSFSPVGSAYAVSLSVDAWRDGGALSFVEGGRTYALRLGQLPSPFGRGEPFAAVSGGYFVRTSAGGAPSAGRATYLSMGAVREVLVFWRHEDQSRREDLENFARAGNALMWRSGDAYLLMRVEGSSADADNEATRYRVRAMAWERDGRNGTLPEGSLEVWGPVEVDIRCPDIRGGCGPLDFTLDGWSIRSGDNDATVLRFDGGRIKGAAYRPVSQRTGTLTAEDAYGRSATWSCSWSVAGNALTVTASDGSAGTGLQWPGNHGRAWRTPAGGTPVELSVTRGASASSVSDTGLSRGTYTWLVLASSANLPARGVRYGSYAVEDGRAWDAPNWIGAGNRRIGSSLSLLRGSVPLSSLDSLWGTVTVSMTNGVRWPAGSRLRMANGDHWLEFQLEGGGGTPFSVPAVLVAWSVLFDWSEWSSGNVAVTGSPPGARLVEVDFSAGAGSSGGGNLRSRGSAVTSRGSLSSVDEVRISNEDASGVDRGVHADVGGVLHLSGGGGSVEFLVSGVSRGAAFTTYAGSSQAVNGTGAVGSMSVRGALLGEWGGSSSGSWRFSEEVLSAAGSLELRPGGVLPLGFGFGEGGLLSAMPWSPGAPRARVPGRDAVWLARRDVGRSLVYAWHTLTVT